MLKRLLSIACCIGFAALLAGPAAAQVRTFILGDGAHPWRGGGDGVDPELLAGSRARVQVDTTNTPGDAIEFDHREGWISPRFFDGSANIAALVLEAGGSIKAPNLLSVSSALLKRQLEGAVNGDHDIAFERKPAPFNPEVATYGIWVVLDFGRLIGVQRVRFYPRNTAVANPDKPFHNDFLRGYEVWVNHRLTNTIEGAPDRLVERVLDNPDPVVDVPVEPQYVRLVKLRSLAENPFEIDEVEVYGTGYLGSGTYLSDLIDLGAPAVVGPVRWAEGLVGEAPFSELAVQVRSGLDDTPVLYQRFVIIEEEDRTEIVEVSGTEYWALERHERLAPEEDVSNWSPWKSVHNGTLNPAPTPRRYIQFRLRFEGGLFATREVDRLQFDYLAPPLADTLRAEIFPRLSAAEEPATFHYAVLLKSAGPHRGYDQIEVDTQVPAERIRQVKINGEPVEFTVEFIGAEAFRIGLPLVAAAGSVLEFTFDLPIFRFGTTFSGRAYNSQFPAVPQRLQPGQVVRFGPTDVDELSGLAVAIPKKQIGKLVGQITLQSRIATPNGDGVNDRFELAFNLLQLLQPAPVYLDIYDLQGRRIRRNWVGDHGIGRVQGAWDGRSGDGRRAAPGTYIWVLRVRADAFEERHSGVLAIAY
ncbi:MAG: hypothetical protein GKR89_11085 [Candidatus Latescibacteria bacterium]|nr:hypothetical protein [Candidatus Latescibacterota bacterium]